MSTQLALIEALWLDDEHPDWILDSMLGEGASNRKLRLLAAAYCRHSWDLLSDERSREAVHAAEAYADGESGGETLAAAQAAAENAAAALPRSANSFRLATAVALLAASVPHTHEARPGMPRISQSGRRWGRRNGVFDIVAVVEAFGNPSPSHRAAYYHLLRDIFGNPFRPVSVDRSWLTALVLSLAAAVYNQRQMPEGTLDPDRLAVLADALEDASCTDDDLLDHLRGPGPHLRGCWAVDLVLAKEPNFREWCADLRAQAATTEQAAQQTKPLFRSM